MPTTDRSGLRIWYAAQPTPDPNPNPNPPEPEPEPKPKPEPEPEPEPGPNPNPNPHPNQARVARRGGRRGTRGRRPQVEASGRGLAAPD